MALLTRRIQAVPRRGPAGGIFHILPMSAGELKRLARAITKIDYLRDGKGRIVFNQKGAAVPSFDTDEEQILAEALKRCPRIDEVTEPVYDGEGNVIGETKLEDPKATAQGLPVGTVIDAEIIRQVLDTLVDVTREVDVPSTPKSASGEGDQEPAGEAPEGAGDPPPTEPQKKPVTVTQMHAEWLLGEAAELGQARIQEERKNS